MHAIILRMHSNPSSLSGRHPATRRNHALARSWREGGAQSPPASVAVARANVADAGRASPVFGTARFFRTQKTSCVDSSSGDAFVQRFTLVFQRRDVHYR
jgi:hypothetical protein